MTKEERNKWFLMGANTTDEQRKEYNKTYAEQMQPIKLYDDEK